MMATLRMSLAQSASQAMNLWTEWKVWKQMLGHPFRRFLERNSLDCRNLPNDNPDPGG